jgi:uracil-DNA glycosylase
MPDDPAPADPAPADPALADAAPAGAPLPAGAVGSLVPPGAWPDDPAGPDTPVARSPGDVVRLAGAATGLAEIESVESVCRACPRLVAWREEVAVVRRRAFRDEPYWGRPIPGWGAPHPGVLIVGLAPAAHGGNRTGRVFTGDRSGDFLFASLYRCGLAAQPTSVARGDGQRLINARIVAAVACAPPENKPEPAERDTCAPWLLAELRLTGPSLKVIVCLGGFAWQAIWPVLRRAGFELPRRRPAFGHGAEVRVPNPHAPGEVVLIGCYHPSQQNTFTGRVTPAMLDDVFGRARSLADGSVATQLPRVNVDLELATLRNSF